MTDEQKKVLACNLGLLTVVARHSPYVAAFIEPAMRRGDRMDFDAIAGQLGMEPGRLVGEFAEEMYNRYHQVLTPLRQGNPPASKSDAPASKPDAPASKPTLSAVK